jgi:Leucine-rich repeat (LRR) protein
LKKINVSRNKISGSLTKEVNDFSTLQELDISFNVMSGELFIPDDFTSIYATNNNFNKLTFESTSSHLVDLYIEANNFSNEDFNTITSLGRLKNLYLTGNNRIDIIPSKINLLKELKVLDVSFTDIKQVPSTLFELSNLSTLNLSDCPQLKAKIINFN